MPPTIPMSSGNNNGMDFIVPGGSNNNVIAPTAAAVFGTIVMNGDEYVRCQGCGYSGCDVRVSGCGCTLHAVSIVLDSFCLFFRSNHDDDVACRLEDVYLSWVGHHHHDRVVSSLNSSCRLSSILPSY